MARFARVVVAEVAHHVTQRGNARQVILSSDRDRATYLELLRHYSELHALALLGYCLMSNHVHLIAVPRACEALAQTLKHAHGRYASYWNARNSSSGHVWQGRFYSCPLDESHLWGKPRDRRDVPRLFLPDAGIIMPTPKLLRFANWSSRTECGPGLNVSLEVNCFGMMVAREGVEPPTPAFSGLRSTT